MGALDLSDWLWPDADRRRSQPVAPEFSGAFPAPTFMFLGSMPGVDLARGLRATQGGTDRYLPGLEGLGFVASGAANCGLDFGVHQAITTPAWTIVILAAPKSNDGVGIAFSQRFAGSPYPLVSVGMNLDASNVGAARPGGFCATINGAAWMGAQSASTALLDGRSHVFIATRAGELAYPRLWLDGAPIAYTINTAYAAGSSSLDALQRTAIGNVADFAGAGIGARFPIAMVACYGQVLTPGQIAAIGANPYTLLAPPVPLPFSSPDVPAPAIIVFGLSASVALSSGAVAPAHGAGAESATAIIQAAAMARATPVAETGVGVAIHAAAAADAQGAVAMAAEAAMQHAPRAPAAPGFALTASAQVSGTALSQAMPAAATVVTAILTAGVQAPARPICSALATARLIARGPVLSATYPALLKSGRVRLTRLETTALHAVQLKTGVIHV
jgi:hypothetical protein